MIVCIVHFSDDCLDKLQLLEIIGLTLASTRPCQIVDPWNANVDLEQFSCSIIASTLSSAVLIELGFQLPLQVITIDFRERIVWS